MDTNDQFSKQYTTQDNSSRVPKISFFLKLIIILLIPLVLIKILLTLPKKIQQSSQNTTNVSVTPYLKQTQSVPPLTQATLDDWSKKLASGSETDFRSVVELPKNQLLFPGALNRLASLAPFHFKLETLKKNADHKSGSIAVDVEAQGKKQTIMVYLRVVNGEWKIVDIDRSSL